jgi:hypothetical protein
MTTSTATTETPAYMQVHQVSKAIARKAAEAGLTAKLTMDGLGRYHAGIVLIEKRGSGWMATSDTGHWNAPSLIVAFKVAADLNRARETMLAELAAMSDDELQALVLDPTAEYTRVQYAMHTLYTARGHKTIKVLPR